MRVQVFNPEGKSIEVIQNVVNIKDCADGRKLVTYAKECKCCKVVSNWVFQVPVGYNTDVFIEALDEVNVVPDRRKEQCKEERDETERH